MNSKPIRIRKVDSGEFEALKSIGQETFIESFAVENSTADMKKYLDANFSLEKVRTELKNPDSEFYFAIAAEQIVGYLKLNREEAQTETSLPNALEIERIYVRASHQGQGIGKLLFEKALEIAKARAAENLWLGVWEKNHKAIRFYEQQGFVAFDQHLFRLGDDIQTDIMMKLSLR